jgi:glycosyltransferase involved in cell wall biosynthesis
LLIEKLYRKMESILDYSIFLQKLAGYNLFFFAVILRLMGLTHFALRIEFFIHRRNLSKFISKYVETNIKKMLQTKSKILFSYLDKYVNNVVIDKKVRNPRNLIGKRILVVKKSMETEKGVIIVDYSYVFPVLIKCFDIVEVFSKYIVVFEPSWSGYCCNEILLALRYANFIVIESGEPRDTAFLKAVCPEIYSAQIAANWWVDYREMKPDVKEEKIFDIIMVSAWARYKCHANIFKVIWQLKKLGKRYRLCLVGYPGDLTKEFLVKKANKYNILDQIEIFECVESKMVAKLLRQSRIQILWSRREGFNRAIIEGMLCGVPVIMREGFNYGHKYDYINNKTGVFANQVNLASQIGYVLNNYGNFNPREWVLNNMSCTLASNILNEVLKNKCTHNKENYTEHIVPKIAGLNSQEYYESKDEAIFKKDYEFLYRCIK